MSDIEFKFDVWLTWWAKPTLWLAVLLRSPRLVRFVGNHGVHWAPAR